MFQSSDSIILCPGQGAQHVGMGRQWFEQSSQAAKVYQAADKYLSYELSQLCFSGPESNLNRTDLAQLAIYVTSIACFHAIHEHGHTGNIVGAAGLSLGEFSALHLAGAFDFQAGLELVRLRGQAMQEAADSCRSGMVAIIGCDAQQATELCDRAGNDDILVPANYNCPGQIVISGTESACTRAEQVAQDMKIKAKRLAVAGAFHSPIMQPAADRLAQALDKVNWNTPTFPVISNVCATPHDHNDIQSIKTRLVDQLTSPVLWTQSMLWTIEHIHGQFLELAPGKVLLGLMRKINRGVKVENFDIPQ